MISILSTLIHSEYEEERLLNETVTDLHAITDLVENLDIAVFVQLYEDGMDTLGLGEGSSERSDETAETEPLTQSAASSSAPTGGTSSRG